MNFQNRGSGRIFVDYTTYITYIAPIKHMLNEYLNLKNLIKSRLVAVATLVLFFSYNLGAQSMNLDKLKALYIYNFTRYMEWPAAMKQGDFVIGVLGNCPIHNELVRMARVKKVNGNRDIVVTKFQTLAQMRRCNAIYISNAYSSKLPEIIQRFKGKGVLIIGDGKDLAKNGACVNFVVKGTSQKFELSERNINVQGIKVAKKFLNLAIKVD